MHAIRTMLRAVLIAVGGLVAATAGADDAASRWILGSQVGQVQGGSDLARASGASSTLSFDVAATWGDKNRLGWRVFTGYQFTDHFAVHVGYADLGKVQSRLVGAEPDRFPAPERLLTHSVRGVDVGVQVKLPLSDRVAVAFRGGKYFWKSRTRGAAPWEITSGHSSRSDSDDFFGAGVEVGVLDGLSATLGWTRYEVAGDPIALWTVGALYGFANF